jgi:hypothetical protein
MKNKLRFRDEIDRKASSWVGSEGAKADSSLSRFLMAAVDTIISEYGKDTYNFVHFCNVLSVQDSFFNGAL